ncbi:hypothetical protein ACFQVD_05905 [Streptosporangium amethystogenes subsp. fukuiense]|uniref:Uncharacterized protein n=1 Tax=Streptosporangium amethystogenes subsp. fukuiense TaxID=698418 RepID=A0ABW2SVZ5_9ACTN
MELGHRRGRASVDALGDDGYGQLIRQGVDRLADRLPTPEDPDSGDGARRRIRSCAAGGLPGR